MGKIAWNKELVQNWLNENLIGYIMLSDEYINARTRYTFRCNKGHIFESTWENVKLQGEIGNHLCEDCRKIDCFNNLLNYIEENAKGYILLDKEYINNKHKMHFVCPDGHDFFMDTGHFKSGRRCPDCSKITAANKRRLSHDYVKNTIESVEGYKLLSTKYINNYTKLKIKCNNNHTYRATFSDFDRGRRCPHCSNRVKLILDDVEEYIESQGYTLISTDYKNGIPLDMICNKGHAVSIRFDHFRSGHRCKICSFEKISGENHYRWNNGRTTLNKMLRTFLDDWKTKSLKSTNYTCLITGYSGELKIHHSYSFNKIVTNILKELHLDKRKIVGEYTDEEMTKIARLFIEYHDKLLGIPLHPKVHKLFHQIYGYGNNTPKQFEEFKIRYRVGEFDKLLNEESVIR